jgi:SAM-dependent methyltransferase
MPYLRDGGRLLDVGSGSADLPHRIARAGGARVLAVAVDVKPAHLREAPPGVEKVVADARALPFPPLSFDVVTASAFLHHFDEGEIAEVIRALFDHARRALVVSDLRRSHAPLLFGRAFFPLLFRSPVSVCDGLVSLRRAFRPGELRAAFVRAGIPWVRVRRRFPYRLVAVAERAPRVAAR